MSSHWVPSYYRQNICYLCTKPVQSAVKVKDEVSEYHLPICPYCTRYFDLTEERDPEPTYPSANTHSASASYDPHCSGVD